MLTNRPRPDKKKKKEIIILLSYIWFEVRKWERRKNELGERKNLTDRFLNKFNSFLFLLCNLNSRKDLISLHFPHFPFKPWLLLSKVFIFCSPYMKEFFWIGRDGRLNVDNIKNHELIYNTLWSMYKNIKMN